MMRKTLRRKAALCLVIAVLLFGSVRPLSSQAKYDAERKLITRVEPDYPETLKRLYIGGTVHVEVVVTPNGNIESMQLIGGNPILGQSAMKAIKQWKYAAGGVKSTFVVTITFDPHQ